MKKKKERILILGGSGFIGLTLYRELQSYYDVRATYYSQIGSFSENHAFEQFDIDSDSTEELLERIKPSLIISALKPEHKHLEKSYEDVCKYVLKDPKRTFLIFSSASVFDAKNRFPAYDDDIPLAFSREGRKQIALEKIVQKEISDQFAIVRLPLVLGINSPMIFHLRQCIKHYASFEVYPNLVVTATTIQKFQQQMHFIVNRSMRGIFHLASSDMIHHDELFKEITEQISDKIPIFKNVYSSNEDQYLALLPRKNRLPKTYQITIAEVVKQSSLSESITSII